MGALLYANEYNYKIVADVITGKTLSLGLSLAFKTVILKIYRSTILSPLLRKVDCFFVNSEAALDLVINNLHISKKRIIFIPLGADNELFRFNLQKRKKAREYLQLNHQDIVAIYTGKLLPHKGVDLLLYASAPIIKTYKNFKVLIVGKGSKEYEKYLKKLIDQLDIGSNVVFHDWVHRTELPNFFNAADFAVWPAHHSISIIEAMSTGLPVIIPKSKWTSHLLKYNNGLTFSQGNIVELHNCIKFMLINSELRERMGMRSRELVDKELNWKIIAKKYLRIYDIILGK